MVSDTMAYFSSSTELEKLGFSKPAQTDIPFNDSILKLLPATELETSAFAADNHRRRFAAALHAFTIPRPELQQLLQRSGHGAPLLAMLATVEAVSAPGTAITDGYGAEEHARN